MNTYLISAIIIILSISSLQHAFGQKENHEHDSDHDHTAHCHINEISCGFGAAFLFEENEYAPGVHLHYVRAIDKIHRLGVGLGFESIMDEHIHNTVTLILEYRIYKGLKISYAPGIVFPNSEHNETGLIHHSELLYELEVGPLHFGPIIGVGIEKETVHALAGIHLGTAF